MINLRTKEANEQRANLTKCVELIGICEKILAKYNSKGGESAKVSEENPQITKDEGGRRKKKKKQKQKKAETLVAALELDTLRSQFEFFEVAMPTGKVEITQALKSLHQKAQEIEFRPLTESISMYSYRDVDEDETGEERTGDSFTFVGSSHSGSVAEDLCLLENADN